MLSIRKMQKSDIGTLFEIALRSFQPDYEKYRVYPPLLKVKQKKFMPPILFGKTILSDDVIIGALLLWD